MKKRERILAIVVGLMVAGVVGNWFFSRMLQGPLAQRQDRVKKLKSDIEKRQAHLRRARQAGIKLAAWQKQSLPSNVEVASSLYQDWLLDLLGRAGFKSPHVDRGEPLAKKGVFHRLPFAVRGRATLGELTQFLYEFYRADHLHQISRIGITPLPKSDLLDLSLSIEALVLPRAESEDQLTTRRSETLASERIEDYQPIVARNLFGQGGGGTDPAEFVLLTAVTDVGGQTQAWLSLRSTGEVLKLRPGDSFEVGQFRGTILEISPPDVVIQSDDERWLLTLGDKLSQATALPPDF
ncbi:MAG: hypothetical protein AB7U73_01645 [Pirellulales bacterium]